MKAVTELRPCVEFRFKITGQFIIRPVVFTVVFLLNENRMQSECRGGKKIGGRKLIQSQS